MKKYLGILAVGAMVVSGFATPSVASRFIQNETISQACNDPVTGELAGTTTYEGPTSLWPPNHKYVPATITWTDEDPADEVMVEFVANHDQFIDGEEINGAGNTDDDITPAMGMPSGTGVVTQDFLIRSERSGRVQEGRYYTISGMVEFTNSAPAPDPTPALTNTCNFSFTIFVPHDQGKGNG